MRSNTIVVPSTSQSVQRPAKKRKTEQIVDLYDYLEGYSSDMEQIRVRLSFTLTKTIFHSNVQAVVLGVMPSKLKSSSSSKSGGLFVRITLMDINGRVIMNALGNSILNICFVYDFEYQIGQDHLQQLMSSRKQKYLSVDRQYSSYYSALKFHKLGNPHTLLCCQTQKLSSYQCKARQSFKC